MCCGLGDCPSMMVCLEVMDIECIEEIVWRTGGRTATALETCLTKPWRWFNPEKAHEDVLNMVTILFNAGAKIELKHFLYAALSSVDVFELVCKSVASYEMISTNNPFVNSPLDRFKTILRAWQSDRKCLTVDTFNEIMDQLKDNFYEPFEVLHNLFEAIFETGGFRSTPSSKEPIASWKSLIEQWTDKSHKTDKSVCQSDDKSQCVRSFRKNQLLWAFAIRSNCTDAIDLMKAQGVFLKGAKNFRRQDPDHDVFNQEMFYIYSFFGLYTYPLKLKGFLTSPGVFIKALEDVDLAYTMLERRLEENAIAHPIAEHLLNLGAEILSKYQRGIRIGMSIFPDSDVSDLYPFDIPTLSTVMIHLLKSWYVSMIHYKSIIAFF
jgi:hypothetical protein